MRLPAGYKPVPGHGVELRPGKDAVIIGYGPVLLPQAYLAAELLKKRDGLDVAVVNLPWLNRVDRELAAQDARRTARGVHARQSFREGRAGPHDRGRGRRARLERAVQVQSFGLADFPACGQNDEVLRAHGLDAESLAAAMWNTLAGKSV